VEKVFVRKVSKHQEESMKSFKPLGEALCGEVQRAVDEIFDAAGVDKMLAGKVRVVIKPNTVDSRPYCFTRTELTEAVINYFKKHQIKNIFVAENCTQGSLTRLVFEKAGYRKMCKRTGAKAVYLDEGKTAPYEFKKRGGNEDEYDNTRFELSQFVIDNLLNDRARTLYINLPKLKTHSMSGATLGVKNQWCFPKQSCRKHDHNYNLHNKLVDVLSYFQPDFTLIEGIEGVVNGHYPVTAFADECIVPFKVLIGSKNVVAADIVGVRVLGLELSDVPHLVAAINRGLSHGVKDINDVEIDGDISCFDKKYNWDLLQRFPDDVKRITGKERWCAEGCKNNPLTLLQTMTYDYNGKGGFTMVMGKGLDKTELESITGKVLIVGKCAVNEARDLLVNKLGKKNVYVSGACNDLTSSLAAMFNLMKVNPLKYNAMPLFTVLKIFAIASLKGSKAAVPFPLAHKIKKV
jgi:uncharacterized protein (DUF362 family)